MAKFKLIPSPTFKAKVMLPQSGEAELVPLEFTFKHRTRDELKEFLERSATVDQQGGADHASDVNSILSMAEGWELADPFNEESLATLVQNHISAPQLILETYLSELTKARAKN
jgi:hypothetical protein